MTIRRHLRFAARLKSIVVLSVASACADVAPTQMAGPVAQSTTILAAGTPAVLFEAQGIARGPTGKASRVEWFDSNGQLVRSHSTNVRVASAPAPALAQLEADVAKLRAHLAKNPRRQKGAKFLKAAERLLDSLKRSQRTTALRTAEPAGFRSLKPALQLRRGQGESVVEYSLGGRTVVRFSIVPEGVVGMGGIGLASSVEDCNNYPPGTPDEQLPAECMDGYDANFDPAPIEAAVAGYVAEADGVQSDLDGYQWEFDSDAGNAMASPDFNRSLGGPSASESNVDFLLATPATAAAIARGCDGEAATYLASVAAFVLYAGQTVGWAVFRQPVKAYEALQKTAAALVAIQIAAAYLRDCLEELEV